jgi:hypothetical protein
VKCARFKVRGSRLINRPVAAVQNNLTQHFEARTLNLEP